MMSTPLRNLKITVTPAKTSEHNRPTNLPWTRDSDYSVQENIKLGFTTKIVPIIPTIALNISNHL